MSLGLAQLHSGPYGPSPCGGEADKEEPDAVWSGAPLHTQREVLLTIQHEAIISIVVDCQLKYKLHKYIKSPTGHGF